MNQYLQGKHLSWAVTAAFGDNLADAARTAAWPLKLNEAQLDQLRELGECLNYNGYGETLTDLHYAPDMLYRIVRQYADPFDLIANEPAFKVLQAGFADDLARSAGTMPAEVRASEKSMYCLLKSGRGAFPVYSATAWQSPHPSWHTPCSPKSRKGVMSSAYALR